MPHETSSPARDASEANQVAQESPQVTPQAQAAPAATDSPGTAQAQGSPQVAPQGLAPDGPAPEEAATAKPGRKPSNRKPLETYPGLLQRDEAGNVVKHPEGHENAGEPVTVPLEAIPSDYDSSKHAVLKRGDFSPEWLWCEWKAQQYDIKAKKFRDEAELIKKGGTKEQQTKLKKFKALTDRVAKLKEELAGDPEFDLDALLAELSGGEEKPEG